MAITTFGLIQWPRPWGQDSTAIAHTGLTINASGDRVAFIVQVPKSGTLDQFEFRVGTVTNNPDNGVKFSFQDIDVTTGLPDAVVDQFANHVAALSSNTWITPDNVMTDTGAGGGVKRTVTKGDMLACVIDFVTFVASDSFNVQTQASSGTLATNPFYIGDASTGTYAKASGIPNLVLKYSDGTYAEFPYPVLPASAINARAFSSSSTPDERALRFQVPVSCRVSGFWVYGQFGANCDMVLYDSDGTTVLGTSTIDSDIRGINNSRTSMGFFSSSVTLAANTTYRLSVKPATTTTITVYDFDVDSAGLMAAAQGGAQLYGSTRTDAGAWTDTTTQRPICGVLIDGFDVSGGGGSAAYAGGGLFG